MIVILILFEPLAAHVKTDAIRLNQIGFYPDGPKLAIVVETSAELFFVTTPDLRDTVYSGELSSARYWEYSGENVKQADFSELQENGTYVVLVPGLGFSNAFDIKPRVFQEIARATTKAFYFQRMSIDLQEEFAGKWFRPMGHPDTEVLVHASAATTERPEGTVIACPRGWYDAGDYNKYISRKFQRANMVTGMTMMNSNGQRQSCISQRDKTALSQQSIPFRMKTHPYRAGDQSKHLDFIRCRFTGKA